jgi:predicted ATPase/DNA-binding SARP family transcriptional activator
MAEPKTSLRLEMLGPIQVHRGPSRISLGPTKQRAVFVALALHDGSVVSMESLLDAVWGNSQPASARQLVHTYIARLRQLFEPEMPPRERVHVIGSTPSGYRLLVDSDLIDVFRFKRLYQRARQYISVSELVRAFDLLGEGLLLWRDPSLAELSALLHTADLVEGLRQTWCGAALDYVAVGLELGRAPAVLPVAHQLAAAEPMHEDVQARYVAALEQTGRRAAAIEHFNDVRAMLSDELGVLPGPQLSGAYHRALRGTEARPDPLPAAGDGLPAVARPPWRGPGPQLGQLVDRDGDLDAVTRILAEQRLLTLAGPPGCGKSALALNAAARLRDEFPGGVVVLECSELADEAELREGLASLLDGGSATAGDVAALLEEQQVLVVLDNVEHLVEACALVVDEIVRACRRVSMIVTSRERLGLPYEAVWRVEPLRDGGLDGARWAGDHPAVRLFARRAAQVDPAFRLDEENVDAVALVCRHLDHLPLAIELAAACLATDTVDELIHRLDSPLQKINPPRRSPPTHHHSLWTALARSVECLDEQERWCFLRLGSIPAYLDPDDAEKAWAGAPWGKVDTEVMLTRLADKSLLAVEHEPSGPRYQMLRLVHRFADEYGAEAA